MDQIMSIKWYILDENNIPQLCSVEEYIKWCNKYYSNDSSIHIRHNHIKDFFISTIFLVFTSIFRENDGKPLLFETMIFNDKDSKNELDHYQVRYYSYQEAIRGHHCAMRMVIKQLRDNYERN